jgi:hypothetical protein
MIKRVVIKDGKKYVVNIPSWDDAPPKVELPSMNEADVNNIPTVPVEPEPHPQ